MLYSIQNGQHSIILQATGRSWSAPLLSAPCLVPFLGLQCHTYHWRHTSFIAACLHLWLNESCMRVAALRNSDSCVSQGLTCSKENKRGSGEIKRQLRWSFCSKIESWHSAWQMLMGHDWWIVFMQVELPLGATEDRICGTIDIEKALQQGIKAYEPGLLVDCHSQCFSRTLSKCVLTANSTYQLKAALHQCADFWIILKYRDSLI